MENQVRLRWASHQGTVLSVFDALLSAETMVDVTLAADGQYLRAHKILLSACSPYFQELLSMDMNKNPIIFMKDVKYSELKALVQFIYRGEVNIAQEDLPSFLAVAQSLQIRGLASVDTPANNLGSDTLILPDFNNSANSSVHSGPAGPSSSAMNANTMSSSFEHEPAPPAVLQSFLQQPSVRSYVSKTARGNQTQCKQTYQSSVPISDQQNTSTIIPPPPAKRLRVQQQRQHDPLDLNPVSIPSSPSTAQTHSSMSTTVSEQMFDPLSTPSTSQTLANFDQDQGRFMDHRIDEQPIPMFQPEEVKVEIGEGIQPSLGGGVYREAEEGEEGDNSMSQSSFAEAWKHDGGQSFEDPDNSMVGQDEDDGEMPGGSGTSGEAGGSSRSGEGDRIECERCGQKFSSDVKGGLTRAKQQLTRHSLYNCPHVPPQFQCQYCQKAIRRKDDLHSPYKCKKCGKEFPVNCMKSALQYEKHCLYHCLYVKAQFQCQYCHVSLRYKSTVTKHEAYFCPLRHVRPSQKRNL